jgi:hypothetical protein
VGAERDDLVADEPRQVVEVVHHAVLEQVARRLEVLTRRVRVVARDDRRSEHGALGARVDLRLGGLDERVVTPVVRRMKQHVALRGKLEKRCNLRRFAAQRLLGKYVLARFERFLDGGRVVRRGGRDDDAIDARISQCLLELIRQLDPRPIRARCAPSMGGERGADGLGGGA